MSTVDLTLEMYAQLLAHAAHDGDALAGALATRNVAATDLVKAHTKFSAELATSFEERKGLLAMKFASAFAQALLDRGALAIGFEGIAPVLAERPLQTNQVEAAEVAPAPQGVPSFLLEQSKAPEPIQAPPPIVPVLSRNQSDATGFLDRTNPVPETALPFATDRPVQAPPTNPIPPRGMDTGTAMTPRSALFQPATPFRQTPSAGEPARDVNLSHMPLDRYAAVTAALAANPDRSAVLRRFVLTEELWRAVAANWAQRIHADPALRAQYLTLVQQAKEQLATAGK